MLSLDDQVSTHTHTLSLSLLICALFFILCVTALALLLSFACQFCFAFNRFFIQVSAFKHMKACCIDVLDPETLDLDPVQVKKKKKMGDHKVIRVYLIKIP